MFGSLNHAGLNNHYVQSWSHFQHIYLNTFGVDSTPSKIPCKGICHRNAQNLQTAMQAKFYEDKQ